MAWPKVAKYRRAYVEFLDSGTVHWCTRGGKEIARHISMGDMLFLKVREIRDNDETVWELKDGNATIQVSTCNVHVYFVPRMFFTGCTGAQHRLLVAKGENYIVVQIHDKPSDVRRFSQRIIWKEDDPNATEHVMNKIECSSCCRVRAFAYDEALLQYDAALAQREAWMNRGIDSTDLQNQWCQGTEKAKAKFGVFDWAGNRMFGGQTWDSFNDAWEAVYQMADKELGLDSTEKEFDDFVGEYHVDRVPSE